MATWWIEEPAQAGGWLDLVPFVRAGVVLLLGLGAARLSGRLAGRLSTGRLSQHAATLTRRAVVYGLVLLFAIAALHQLGFDLSVVLGAAGIFTVALGFASQTSASNMISGLFLLGERSFSIGDIVRVGDTTGEVLSIDLLSVKLRTFDNLLVRIPNETLIKTQLTNLTRFPIRRYDLKVGVAYREDIERVRAVLEEVADRNPMCLDEPAPLFIFLGFGESSLDIQFSVWARRESFLELRNRMHTDVKAAFDEAGIEIPFPHRTLYTGSRTAPFPVDLGEGGERS